METSPPGSGTYSVRLRALTTSQQDDADRAEAIASRVAGVVTVENRLRRDFAIDTNVAPALGRLGDELRGLRQALPLFAVAFVIGALVAAFGYWLAGRKRLWRRLTSNVFLAELVGNSVRTAFLIGGAVIMLELLGATALLGAVLGGAGVIGIALGFAMRDTVDNYVSSVMLSIRQPFRANDHIVIDDKEGRVVRLTSRATILMTLDGNHLRIPNAIVFKSVILNYTRNPQRRFEFDLGIDAEDDALAGMAVGLDALKGRPFVLGMPEPSAVIEAVGDSSIGLRFYGWIDQGETDFLKGRSLAIHATKSALEAAGFTLPEPIYRLRFDEGAGIPPVASKAGREKRKAVRPSSRGHGGAGAGETVHDTAPEPAVDRMVREERAAPDSGDLLDAKQPIE